MGNHNKRLICSLNFLVAVISSQSFAKPLNSRILTSWFSVWDIIHFEESIRHGILPNFSKINESDNDLNYHSQLHSDGIKILQSSPGCPEPFEGAPWVYGSFGDHRPKCYLSGFQGPCPLNMKLYPQSSSYYGYCDCSCKEYFGNKINVPRAYCIGSGPELNSKRILAFDKVSDTCHILFKQGRCNENEWFVFGDDPTQGLICEERQCPSEPGEDFSFYDFKTRECHRLGEECGNKPNDTQLTSSSLESDHNWARHSYLLDENSWIPNCQIDENYQEIEYKFYGRSIEPFQCKAYERFSLLLQRCVPIFVKRNGLG